MMMNDEQNVNKNDLRKRKNKKTVTIKTNILTQRSNATLYN